MMKEQPPKQSGLMVGGFDGDSPVVKCSLCSELLWVKKTVKGKPYFSCPDCGLRTFISKPGGLKRLSQVLSKGGV